MKVYSFYTKSHEELKNKWFLKTAQKADNFDFILENKNQKCFNSCFMEEGWVETMIDKVNLILRAIKENPGQVFIHSDVDIQFFRPIREIIEKKIKNKDAIFQREFQGEICAGFFAAWGNEKNFSLWNDIKTDLTQQNRLNDQDLLNQKLLNSSPTICRKLSHRILKWHKSWLPNKYNLKWGYLPTTFFNPVLDKKKIFLWEPGVKLNIPNKIVLHHANWTIGVENKIKQLEHVRKSWEELNQKL